MKLIWSEFLYKEKNKKYFLDILLYLKKNYSKKKIYPKRKDLFKVFSVTELNEIQVVILGQDPYNGYHQAHGLAFSVPIGVNIPPSLLNIFKELKNDFNKPDFIFNNGCLLNWAKQGVFLLNSILTVEYKKPLSHNNLGWKIFTDKVIYIINKYRKGIIFLLWGSYAKSKINLIDRSKHFILTASHPSPLSVNSGFFGCKHFSKTNNILKKIGGRLINWFNL